MNSFEYEIKHWRIEFTLLLFFCIFGDLAGVVHDSLDRCTVPVEQWCKCFT